jgi:DNA-binding response OmpR family regulator
MQRTISVLLIDDDLAQCETLADILADHDCSVIPCSDPVEGEELGRTHVFDLVLLDLKMNGHNGLDLLRGIRTQSHPCVVVLTGIAETSTKRAALAGGADAVMEKPVDIPRLLSIARDIQTTGDCKESSAAVPVP